MKLNKLFQKVLGRDKTGTPCYVIAREADIVGVMDGVIGTNLDNAIEIRYKWLDNTIHRFIDIKQNYVGLMRGKPLFRHNVGSLYGEGIKSKVGSEYFNKIVESAIGTQMLEALEELREEGGIPFKKILIFVGIAVLFIYLWKSGFLAQVMGDILPTVGGS